MTLAIDQTMPDTNKVSGKYVFISTASVVKAFTDKGYFVHSYNENMTRKPSRQGYQPHLVRLRHPDFIIPNRPDLTPEVVIFTAHDGSLAERIFMGMFRGACCNGNIFGESFFFERVTHRGNAMLRVEKAVQAALDARPRVIALIETLTNKQVSVTEAMAYASRVAKARLETVENLVSFNVDSLLHRERPEDTANDLWTLFNVVQEKLIRGGLEYTVTKSVTDAQGNVTQLPEKKTTRPTRSISNQVGFNTLAFDEALKLAA